MRRILFVDDDVNILEGLQNLLRSHRREWHMVFVNSGAEAMAALEREPFDVIVTDMRMPGVDGATLLRHVKTSAPQMARIVLSGHADRDAVLRALPVAHQFLSKPCDAEALRAVIERTCNLQALLHDQSMREAIGSLASLPSPNATFVRLVAALQRPDIALSDVADIVAADPAMSAKVLQLVNSAYFGLAQNMSSIAQAVKYLGVELLKVLTLSAHVFSIMTEPIPHFSIDEIQTNALATARLARRLFADPQVAEQAFCAAVLRDVGQIAMASTIPAKFSEVVRVAADERRPLHQVEREAFGVCHGGIGAYLLGVWGVPFGLVEAVAYHHIPSLVLHGDRRVLVAVHVADVLVKSGAASEDIDLACLDACGVIDQLPRWRELAADQADAGFGRGAA